MEKLRIPYPILVEGKYDKIKLDSLVTAQILCTDGFGIFRQREKAALLRRIAAKTPLIVLTDSDGAGLVIRNLVNSILPKEKIIHLYTPAIHGKERRKSTPSKAGILGVEGTDADRLRALFLPFCQDTPSEPEVRPVTKADFYAWGLSGGADSAKKRQALCTFLELPTDMSANALLTAVNLLHCGDRVQQFCNDLEESLC